MAVTTLLRMPVPTKTTTERQLIEGCIANNRSVQEQVYRTYYNPMLALCLRYTGNEADAIDVLHQGFLNAYRQMSEYKRAHTSLYISIHRTMVKTAIEFLRKQTLRLDEMTWNGQADPQIQPQIFLDKSPDELLGFLHQLSRTSATVFNLHVIEGYSLDETAELLNVSEQTIKWHLSEARKELKFSFEKRTLF